MEMKIQQDGKTTIYKHLFNSLNEFTNYLNKAQVNSSIFKKTTADLRGEERKQFAGTESLIEAYDLLRNGWQEGAKKIEGKLKLEKIKESQSNQTKVRVKNDVIGFQANVPRYLQGIPQNMINQKKVPQKQKIITIIKNITYSACTEEWEIIENSVKALEIVRKIEAQGIRTNLDVVLAVETHNKNEMIFVRVRIKSAGERLNVAKMAFCLVHPSMLRRIFFQYIETHPEITQQEWYPGKGTRVEDTKMRKLLESNEYYLESFIKSIDDEVKKMKIN